MSVKELYKKIMPTWSKCDLCDEWTTMRLDYTNEKIIMYNCITFFDVYRAYLVRKGYVKTVAICKDCFKDIITSWDTKIELE